MHGLAAWVFDTSALLISPLAATVTLTGKSGTKYGLPEELLVNRSLPFHGNFTRIVAF